MNLFLYWSTLQFNIDLKQRIKLIARVANEIVVERFKGPEGLNIWLQETAFAAVHIQLVEQCNPTGIVLHQQTLISPKQWTMWNIEIYYSGLIFNIEKTDLIHYYHTIGIRI